VSQELHRLNLHTHGHHASVITHDSRATLRVSADVILCHQQMLRILFMQWIWQASSILIRRPYHAVQIPIQADIPHTDIITISDFYPYTSWVQLAPSEK